MTRVTLLEQLRDVTHEATDQIMMPVRFQKGDQKQIQRAADIYLMRLRDSSSAQKKVPYIIHQIITGKDIQPPGGKESAVTVVRSIFCVYHEDEQEGAMMLMNLMERLRIHLLKRVVIGNQFQLDLAAGMELLIYPDDTAPYYAGEMLSTWKLPSVEREVNREKRGE